MSIARATHEAVNAANKVEQTPGAPIAVRLSALLQLQRHVDGLVDKLRGESAPAGQNRPAVNTGD